MTSDNSDRCSWQTEPK